MRFGSVCSGIEAASVAWHPLGWTAAWLSEIEPFPSAVLKHHYPDVPNLGDMTLLPERILSGEVEAPDLFCGGTPCQAFSVAGLRNSLDDARGNLSLTFVGIANAIDYVRSVRSDDPAIIFWENVPGVLNTKDNAFGCFLGALAGEDDPIIASGEKWTNAGCVYGSQRTVAWRVLDAQYFGVAQRRRRVFVVASARDDFDPVQVLFEFDGVRRDSAPSREAGQKPAPCVTNGPPFSRTGNERVEAEAMVVQPYEVGNCLTARMHKGINSTLDEGQTPVIAFHPTQNPISNVDGTTHVLSCGSSSGQASIAVAQPIPIDLRNAGRDPEKHDAMNRQGVGVGEPGDPAHTVTSAFVHGVAQPVGTDCYNGSITGDVAATMGTSGSSVGASGPTVMQPVGFDLYNNDVTGDVSKTIDTGQDYHHVPNVLQTIGFTTEQTPKFNHDQALTLTKQSPSGGGQVQSVMQNMMVRRLTPVECERLQGFPDGYTNIPWRKKDESPDGPRYKALGNSWAVPVVAWIGHRIQQELQK